MRREQVEEFFDAHPQFDRQAWLALAQPCLDISFAAEDPSPASSRFGGPAFLPANFVWPAPVAGGTYEFLGQINFAEIKQRPVEFPESGLLTLLFAEDDAGTAFWGDDGYIHGLYWSDTSGFKLQFNPDGLAQKYGTFPPGWQGKKIEFQLGIDLPVCADLIVDWPADKDQVLAAFDGSGVGFDGMDFCDHMLGYPVNDSFGYDPRPEYRDNAEGRWLTLLNVVSHEDLGWTWHDGDKLMVFIEAEALQRRDFSQLKSDAG